MFYRHYQLVAQVALCDVREAFHGRSSVKACGTGDLFQQHVRSLFTATNQICSGDPEWEYNCLIIPDAYRIRILVRRFCSADGSSLATSTD